jgi:hypothetical protein
MSTPRRDKHQHARAATNKYHEGKGTPATTETLMIGMPNPSGVWIESLSRPATCAGHGKGQDLVLRLDEAGGGRIAKQSGEGY